MLDSENKISSLTKEIEELRVQANTSEELAKQLEEAKQTAFDTINKDNMVQSSDAEGMTNLIVVKHKLFSN